MPLGTKLEGVSAIKPPTKSHGVDSVRAPEPWAAPQMTQQAPKERRLDLERETANPFFYLPQRWTHRQDM